MVLPSGNLQSAFAGGLKSSPPDWARLVPASAAAKMIAAPTATNRVRMTPPQFCPSPIRRNRTPNRFAPHYAPDHGASRRGGLKSVGRSAASNENQQRNQRGQRR